MDLSSNDKRGTAEAWVTRVLLAPWCSSEVPQPRHWGCRSPHC